ncbi:Uncharacterised protein [Mycobacteroides abscessus]|nr:Uncharacterised protein [Mycobacteroides abscessus]
MNRAANALRDRCAARAIDASVHGSPGASCTATSTGARRSSARPGSNPGGRARSSAWSRIHRKSCTSTTSKSRSARTRRPQRTSSISRKSRSSVGSRPATSSSGSTSTGGSVRTRGWVAPPSTSSVAHAKSESSVGALWNAWSSGRG